MGQLVDSSVFIRVERRASESGLLELFKGRELLSIAAISVSELLVGVHRADSPTRALRRRRFVETVLENVNIEPFDLEVAERHARLWAELASQGQPLPAHDMQIAATALARGYGLLTHDLRDFSRVPGLTIERP